MTLEFYKYHGAGNDFIILDSRSRPFAISNEDIAFLCDRHFGIGADGLISLKQSEHADVKMVYFNADGREGSMCGNGGRCVAAFMRKSGLEKELITIEAPDGLHEATIGMSSGSTMQVTLSMADVLSVEDKGSYCIAETGSPHYVGFVDDLDQIDVFAHGADIRWSKQFQPGGINVNFAQVTGNKLMIRTYERGVENITLSCGTGTVAAALAAKQKGLFRENSVKVTSLGGELTVQFECDREKFINIRLSGPATFVFSGIIKW